jgi:hypothetical protein
MEELIEGLAKLETDSEVTPQKYLHEQEWPEAIFKVERVSGLANCLVRGGDPDWTAIKVLEDRTHYKVFAGEKDSFGWLTGCILTRKGILVFG